MAVTKQNPVEIDSFVGFSFVIVANPDQKFIGGHLITVNVTEIFEQLNLLHLV